MKHLITLSVAFMVLTILMGLACSGQRTEVGTLTGVKATMSVESAISGRADDIRGTGVVVVTLDDGTEVDAVCSEEIWNNLVGGQKLEITPLDSTYWEVLRIVEE